MKAFPSSESAYERREREIARRARNCILAAIVVYIAVSIILYLTK